MSSVTPDAAGHVPIQGSPNILPVFLAKFPVHSKETIESMQGIAAPDLKSAAADNPVLVPPELLLWLNMLSLTPSASQEKDMPIENITAAIELKQQEIVIKMLNAWNDSVKQDAEQAKIAMKKYTEKMDALKADLHQEEIKAERGSGPKSGSDHERWLKSLTNEERVQFEESGAAYIQNRYNFDNAVSKQADAVVSAASGSSGAVPSGTGYQTAMVGLIAVQLGGISPLDGAVGGAQDSIMQTFQQAVPTYAVDLSLIVAANNVITINLAVVQTLQTAGKGGGAEEKQVEGKFASQYAQEVIKSINGDQFPNFVLSIVAHAAEGGESLTEKQVNELILKAKVVWLSTAMALLYKLSTSVKGEGGGVSGQEFLALLDGKDVSPAINMLRDALLGVLEQLPAEDASMLVNSFAGSLHSNIPISTLADPGKMFASFYAEHISSYPIA